MKKQFQHLKLFLPVLIIITALSSHAQKQFTHTSTKANNWCNGTCTLIDVPELNNNPNAVILVTEIASNAHPILAYYIQTKKGTTQWSIMNMDNSPMVAETQFTVQYFPEQDKNHFVHVVTMDNNVINEDKLKKKGSYINHVGLNENAAARFQHFQNWAPSLRGGLFNKYDIQFQYDSLAGRWYMTNTNGRALSNSTSYNILITNEGNTVSGSGKGDTSISKKDPKIILKATDTVAVITPPVDKKIIANKKPIAPAYDFSKIHICIDKETNNSLPPKTPFTPQRVIPKINFSGGIEPVTTVIQPLSGYTELLWTAGDNITVGFLPGGDEFLTSKVKHFVKEWETFANITFQFVTDITTAQIRVGFEMDNTSWSYIGRNVLGMPSGSKTMNFGWFDTSTEDAEFRWVILHEFGHALGFIHEHQSPAAGIPWDREKVYAFYKGPPTNWDIATINANIFAKYLKTTNNSSVYDPLSIMHYTIPAELTTDGSSVGWNTFLSATDKAFVRQVYPFQYIPPTVSGVLKTGDDCDEIEFTVEYNAVHKSEVEFILQPGYDHHNALVNWWKMIGIPLKGYPNLSELFLNTSRRIDFDIIDQTKPITFGKAKVLGVHTGLGYTWAPWPAIVGGCRVKLVWRRDSCN